MERRTYSRMLHHSGFDDRFEYLKLHDGKVGGETFGSDRYLNQKFYMSKEWQDFRHQIIVRDNGCDLGVEGREIYGPIQIHHITPVTKQMIVDNDPLLFDPDNAVCTSPQTHKALHYGSLESTFKDYEPRRPNDTTPWKEQR